MSVYNEAQYIGAAIKSIINQTYRDFEFIIIDDGSTDDTEDIVKTFNDERIIYKKIEKIFFSKALNYAISLSKHNIIARMDGDDIALPDRFEKQINFLKKHSDVKVLSTSYALFRDNSVTHIYHPYKTDSEIKRNLNYENPLTHPGVMFYKSQAEKYGFYKDTLDCFEDVDLWQRMRDDTNFANINEVLILRRMKKNSLTNFERTKPKEFTEQIFFKNFDRKYYKSDREAYIDYALLTFRYNSVSDFRIYVSEKNLLSNPEVLFYYIWSFISRKDFPQWLRWKFIAVKTFFNNDRKPFENLIRSLSS